MDLRDAKRLKELERENAQLKKVVAEQMLENRAFKKRPAEREGESAGIHSESFPVSEGV